MAVRWSMELELIVLLLTLNFTLRLAKFVYMFEILLIRCDISLLLEIPDVSDSELQVGGQRTTGFPTWQLVFTT